MAKVPTIAKPFHAATGAPSPPEWAGYWTFVTAVILVMFVLFVAGKGTLSTWLGFLNWGDIRALSLGSAAPGTPVGSVAGVPGVTTLSPGATGIVTGPGGTEQMNPGPAFDPFKYLPNFLGGH